MIEIKNIKDLLAQIGKPILLGIGKYPSDCFCWIGILKGIGTSESCEIMDKKTLERVCDEFVNKGITDYITQLCLDCKKQVCIYDGKMCSVKQVIKSGQWYGDDWYGDDWVWDGDFEFLRMPTEEELNNYQEKIKILDTLKNLS